MHTDSSSTLPADLPSIQLSSALDGIRAQAMARRLSIEAIIMTLRNFRDYPQNPLNL